MVVFPSWLPFFLQNPQNNATQINAKNARNDKNTQSAATNVRGYIDKRFENSFFRLDARLVLH